MRNFVATSLVAAMTAAALGAGSSLVQSIPTASSGADFSASFNSEHTVFDLNLTSTADWTAAEVRVEVVRPDIATIWHASDQTLGSDPNNPGPLDNLLPTTGTAAKTRSYDTQMGIPNGTLTTANFATTGVSNATDIYGLNPIGDIIPLAWFNTSGADANANFRGLRLTLEHDAATQPLLNTAGGVLVATVVGQTREAGGVFANFSYSIYAVPEPATVALLGLGGLATLLRRR